MATVNPPTETHQDGDSPDDNQRSLRNLYIGCSFLLIPAFSFAVPYGVMVNEWDYPFGSELLPTLGLIPVGLGAVFALYRALILTRKLSKNEYRILLPESSTEGSNLPKWFWPALESLANIAFAVSILAVLIPTWIVASEGHWVPGWATYRYDRYMSDGPAWLAAYASVSMMASMALHIWIAWKVKPKIEWKTPSARRVQVCPHCSSNVTTAGPSNPKTSPATA